MAQHGLENQVKAFLMVLRKRDCFGKGVDQPAEYELLG